MIVTPSASASRGERTERTGRRRGSSPRVADRRPAMILPSVDLPGPVLADKAVDRAALDLPCDVHKGMNASEVLAQCLHDHVRRRLIGHL